MISYVFALFCGEECEKYRPGEKKKKAECRTSIEEKKMNIKKKRRRCIRSTLIHFRTFNEEATAAD